MVAMDDQSVLAKQKECVEQDDRVAQEDVNARMRYTPCIKKMLNTDE